MSQIINELATIEVSNEVLLQLDVGNIYQSFSNNYRKLDDLKNFRSDYEKKNRLMRWWHNDKLRDAQLDSAEVQAEFSKTIGQLMMISIMQSKKLAEQQAQLNEQQSKLKMQADGIAEHAGELQQQHQVLAAQSEKLENLMHEYFALKGLTEDGAQKLIEIAKEVKATKDEMLQAFAVRTRELGVQYSDIVAEQQAMHQNMAKIEQKRREIEAGQREQSAAFESSLLSMSTKLETQEAGHQDKFGLMESKFDEQGARVTGLASHLSNAEKELAFCVAGQKTLQETLNSFQYEMSRRIKRLSYLAAGLSVAVLGMLGGMMYLLRLI